MSPDSELTIHERPGFRACFAFDRMLSFELSNADPALKSSKIKTIVPIA